MMVRDPKGASASTRGSTSAEHSPPHRSGSASSGLNERIRHMDFQTCVISCEAGSRVAVRRGRDIRQPKNEKLLGGRKLECNLF